MTSEERRELRYWRRREKRDAARLSRSQRYGDYEEVFSFRHLYLSGKRCCKNVYWKNSTQRFIGNIIPNVAKLHRELMADTFKHKGFHTFTLVERGKVRHIRSVHITERVVQKCLCDYCIVPIYSASFVYDNSASLKKRGMDFALRRTVCHLQRHYRKYGWTGGILVYDFRSFFDSIPHAPLFAESARKLHDPRIKRLADSFIQDFGNVGLGLGSQVSQINALMLPSPLDHYCKDWLGIDGYSRYMDDGHLIHHDLEYLESCKEQLETTCAKLGLTLNSKKTKVISLEKGFKFLKTKFILTDSGEVILKMNRESTTIMRRKLRSFKRWSDEGTFTMADIRQSYESHKGHMQRGNSFKVLNSTGQYFKSIYGFYPDEKGWLKNVQNNQKRSDSCHYSDS